MPAGYMWEFFNSFTPHPNPVRYTAVMRLFFALLLGLSHFLAAQSVQSWQGLPMGMLPEKILSGRTAVIYVPGMEAVDVSTLHQSLVRTGIDAIMYAETDRVFASDEITRAFAAYFIQREINNLIFVSHANQGWQITVTAFTGNAGLITPEQHAWHVTEKNLTEALNTLYRTALNQYRRQNWLLIEVPEHIKTIPLFSGNRNERFAYDLKVDGLAVEKTGNAALDASIEEAMAVYPFKWKLVEPGTSEADLRRQGLAYLLRFAYARNAVLRELLGYTVQAEESAFVSVTFPNGQEQIKTLPANTYVYKVYVRHASFGHVFLGPKWDADTTLQQALKNFIYGLRLELRAN
jgi:hypothetical protein